MMTKFNVSLTKTTEVESAFDDMFSDLPELDPFEIKKQYIAADLLAILAFERVSKKTLAEDLGWHKSAVTRLFSGKCNPTIKTVWSLSTYLGYDFDITFRKHHEPSNRQPWHTCEIAQRDRKALPPAQDLHFVEAQTPEQVKADLAKGIQKGDVYAIFKTPEKNKSKNLASEQFLVQHHVPNTVNTIFNSTSHRTTIVTK
jgi:transcriptional regulator with XRE-family HTH domain